MFIIAVIIETNCFSSIIHYICLKSSNFIGRFNEIFEFFCNGYSCIIDYQQINNFVVIEDWYIHGSCRFVDEIISQLIKKIQVIIFLWKLRNFSIY